MTPESPFQLLSAIKGLYPQLSASLSKPAWKLLRPKLDDCVAALDLAPGAAHDVAAAKAIQLMAANETARQLMAARLTAQNKLLASAAKSIKRVAGKSGA